MRGVVGMTLDADERTQVHWQHRENAKPAFDPAMFDDNWLAKKQYIINSPTAGRGASLFLKIGPANLVLRHYRRGGLVRSISKDRYAWMGLNRTRAWREFEVLMALEQLALPSPKPYACQVRRFGMTYSATLVTYYLEGSTLAERVCTAEVPKDQWHSIGECIRRFHAAGVNHADLNAHNILIADDASVSLIDFDRATIGRAGPHQRFDKNLTRLKRSLTKIGCSGLAYYDDNCWAALTGGYEQF